MFASTSTLNSNGKQLLWIKAAAAQHHGQSLAAGTAQLLLVFELQGHRAHAQPALPWASCVRSPCGCEQRERLDRSGIGHGMGLAALQHCRAKPESEDYIKHQKPTNLRSSEYFILLPPLLYMRSTEGSV